MSQTARLIGGAFDQARYTPEDVERTPYASIGVSAGDRAEIMVVLATVDGQDLHWIAADNTLIVTRHGRIVRWQGSDGAMAEVAQGTRDPIGEGSLGTSTGQDCLRLIDFPIQRRYGVVTRSTLAEDGVQPVELLHGTAHARHFVETGGAAELDWNFRNEFFLDPTDRRILKSVQEISPAVPPIEIRILRPYLGSDA